MGYDPAHARALLAQSGHAHGAGIPAITLQVRNDELQPSVAEALQRVWRDTLGVQVATTPLEQKTGLRNQKKPNYPPSTFTWIADFPDPLTFLSLFTSDNGNNWTGWRDRAYVALIAAATTMTDAAARLETFQRAEALEQSPIQPLQSYSRFGRDAAGFASEIARFERRGAVGVFPRADGDAPGNAPEPNCNSPAAHQRRTGVSRRDSAAHETTPPHMTRARGVPEVCPG